MVTIHQAVSRASRYMYAYIHTRARAHTRCKQARTYPCLHSMFDLWAYALEDMSKVTLYHGQ